MLPAGYEKKSFRRFNTPIDMEALRKDYHSISFDDWATSYWGHVHCSVGMLLLRGGDKGTPEDFYSDDVFDNVLLEKLPYIKHLLSEDGPFGKAYFAFMFKTQPNGVTLRHQDLMDKWKDLYRIHIPIHTNPGAFLIANDYSQHYATGYAWSFDNHSDHGVVNGNDERIHLIFDVEYNEKTKQQIDNADIFQGDIIEENNKIIANKSKAVPSYMGDIEMKNAIATLRSRGVNDVDIANFFNSKKIPSKSYPTRKWDDKMVSDLASNLG